MDDTVNLYAEIAQREMARRHYADYLAYVQGELWKRTKMSEYIAAEVQKFIEADTGHAYDVLVIETPPQHGKSVTVTETLPSWYLGKHPNNRVIIASYDSDFAEKFCRRNKEKVKTAGVSIFGIGIGAVDRAGEFELNNGKGRLISRGIMSGITGNPANLIIIDDPVKNQQEADSPTYRSRVWEEWQSSLKTRLQAHGKVILIMTPWHEDDFAARVLESEPNSSLLRLPIEAEENDPLGRAVGDSLCPELGKDNEWLHDFKQSYIHDPKGGQRSWTALYQCSPRAETGNIVHRDWWRFYDPEDADSRVRQFGKQIVSVDATFKDTDTSDFVSIQVWGKHLNDYYLLYCLNKRMDFPATIQALKTVKALYPQARAVYIEDKANGSAIIQTLQHEMYCIPVNPRGGKKARVNAVSFAIESGHVYIPAPGTYEWVAGFIDQFTAFPNGAHDDMVDACSQALNVMLYDTGELPSDAPPSERDMKVQRAERQFNNPNLLFNPYNGGFNPW